MKGLPVCLFVSQRRLLPNEFVFVSSQVGVQCEVEPEAGAAALEEKVNAVLPLQGDGKNDDEDSS